MVLPMSPAPPETIAVRSRYVNELGTDDVLLVYDNVIEEENSSIRRIAI